jgi:hypothetical protein
MAHFIPTIKDVNALEVAQLFFDEIWCRHGLSLDIVSDRDTKFTSAVWQRLCKLWPMAQSMSTGFHPQTDGQTERTNRTLEQILRCYVSPTMDNWDTLLKPAEFAFNNAPSASTGYSPFFLNNMRHPRIPTAFIKTQRGDNLNSSVPTVEEFVEQAELHIARAKAAIHSAQ